MVAAADKLVEMSRLEQNQVSLQYQVHLFINRQGRGFAVFFFHSVPQEAPNFQKGSTFKVPGELFFKKKRGGIWILVLRRTAGTGLFCSELDVTQTGREWHRYHFICMARATAAGHKSGDCNQGIGQLTAGDGNSQNVKIAFQQRCNQTSTGSRNQLTHGQTRYRFEQ